jgi:hypothetical protein
MVMRQEVPTVRRPVWRAELAGAQTPGHIPMHLLASINPLYSSRIPDGVLRPILASTLAIVGGRLVF